MPLCFIFLAFFFLLSISLSLSLTLCSTKRRMTRTVTKGHPTRGGRISRFLIKRPVPLGYHGHAWHAIRVIAFDSRTRFPELFGCESPVIQCSLRSWPSVLVITDTTRPKNLATIDGRYVGYAFSLSLSLFFFMCARFH